MWTNLGQEQQRLGEVSRDLPPEVEGQLLLRFCDRNHERSKRRPGLVGGGSARVRAVSPFRYASVRALICWLDLEAKISIKMPSLVPAP